MGSINFLRFQVLEISNVSLLTKDFYHIAARYSKINLDIVSSWLNIQDTIRYNIYIVFDIISRLWCQECKESCLVLKIT